MIPTHRPTISVSNSGAVAPPIALCQSQALGSRLRESVVVWSTLLHRRGRGARHRHPRVHSGKSAEGQSCRSCLPAYCLPSASPNPPLSASSVRDFPFLLRETRFLTRSHGCRPPSAANATAARNPRIVPPPAGYRVRRAEPPTSPQTNPSTTPRSWSGHAGSMRSVSPPIANAASGKLHIPIEARVPSGPVLLRSLLIRHRLS